MKTINILLESDSLWDKVKQQTNYALNCGALKSIPTEYELIKDGDIDFVVRILSNLTHKDNAKKQQKKIEKKLGKDFNPFLPYEEDLFVTNISDTHLCLLNKFNVVDHHLLIITREFKDQETWLNFNDFAALWACLLQIDGLSFYNSGKLAGASQHHKHLQLIPLPLISEGAKVPIETVIKTAEYQGKIGKIPCFKFTHALINLETQNNQDILELAQLTLENYQCLLEAVGMSIKKQEKPDPYNLLVTREWMMIIPRSQSKFESISINSLGFVGALLVKNEQQMQTLKELSPLTILTNVACSSP
ncbi:phosphorylase [Crocosphaera sp. XPORK-15E]|uniref:ATP adenylyltransferase family protein n=1 Tax=Crocosphaera sp. XPORK-15E TaxID=3110247 RepID=UPI002B1F257A|nr:phosphorylase [Crocosphaera sp. XPORK-15E]MEA5532633.1 phosphorylase [Crocosphaera sp. XPORK-15E]